MQPPAFLPPPTPEKKPVFTLSRKTKEGIEQLAELAADNEMYGLEVDTPPERRMDKDGKRMDLPAWDEHLDAFRKERMDFHRTQLTKIMEGVVGHANKDGALVLSVVEPGKTKPVRQVVSVTEQPQLDEIQQQLLAGMAGQMPAVREFYRAQFPVVRAARHVSAGGKLTDLDLARLMDNMDKMVERGSVIGIPEEKQVLQKLNLELVFRKAKYPDQLRAADERRIEALPKEIDKQMRKMKLLPEEAPMPRPSGHYPGVGLAPMEKALEQYMVEKAQPMQSAHQPAVRAEVNQAVLAV